MRTGELLRANEQLSQEIEEHKGTGSYKKTQ
jgi:hypothetical protein